MVSGDSPAWRLPNDLPSALLLEHRSGLAGGLLSKQSSISCYVLQHLLFFVLCPTAGLKVLLLTQLFTAHQCC